MEISSVVDRGFIDLTSEQLKQYKDDDCESLMKDIGSFILKSFGDTPPKDIKIIFFPTGLDNILNLSQKQNITLFGEKMIAPLFYIAYDNDLNFKAFKKGESKIYTKMHYMIIV